MNRLSLISACIFALFLASCGGSSGGGGGGVADAKIRRWRPRQQGSV